jgi:hypothetical protein
MSERIRIEVQASPTHPTVLAVEDAMRQVLSFMSLLPEQTAVSDLVWALAHVSMSSPLIIEAEAKSLRVGVDVSLQARKQKEVLDKRLRAVQRGEMPTEWVGTPKATIAIEMLKRTTNGLGKTTVVLDEAPVVFDVATAQESLALLNAPAVHQFRAHQEIGSIEGNVISVGSYYDQAALRVRDRRNGEEVVCIVPDDLHATIANAADFEDVWNKARVTVRGRLFYDARGIIRKVESDKIEKMTPGTIGFEALYDPEFTEGLDPVVYLERWREGA